MSNFNHVFIFGLARSGTSILWKCFRKDPRFLALDEPFGIDLHMRVRARRILTEEFQREYRDEPVRSIVNRHWSPVLITEQNVPYMQSHQLDYLARLVGSHPHTCIKLMGCHAKISEIKSHYSDALCMLVIRDPRGFVTSHAIPGGAVLMQGADPETFFNHYRMPSDEEDVWGYRRLASLYGVTDNLAVDRLSKLWFKANMGAMDEGPDVVMPHESFARSPKAFMDGLYGLMGLNAPENIEYDEVHEPRLGFEPDHKGWDDARGLHAKVMYRIENEWKELLHEACTE